LGSFSPGGIAKSFNQVPFKIYGLVNGWKLSSRAEKSMSVAPAEAAIAAE
jgi:hypothetical protein